MGFVKTKKYILDGTTVSVTDMEGKVLDSPEQLATEEEAYDLWMSMAKEVNDDPELRIELQKENEWTVYEIEGAAHYKMPPKPEPQPASPTALPKAEPEPKDEKPVKAANVKPKAKAEPKAAPKKKKAKR